MTPTIETALYNLLSAADAIVDLVADRVYPESGGEAENYPLITYQLLKGASEQSHSGISGLAHPIFQINCLAKSFSDVCDLGEAVRLTLQAYQGTVAGVHIQSSRLIGSQDLYNKDSRVYLRALDFEIWHKEAQS